jgi:GAF domain-containing protein/anti-sigma regulatory factor (Ser/Thr protein kinase)
VTQEEALELATRTVFEESRYHVVAATIVLEESDEQLLVADLTRDGAVADRHRRPRDAGLVGAALTSGRQIMLGDAQADPRFHWPTPLTLRSLLVTPVVVDGRSVAALELWDAHSDRFDRFDAALMQHVADHLAAAWRSIDLRELSERRAQRLELALEVTRGVAAATSPEGALASAVEALTRSTAFRSMAAVLADHHAGEQMLVGARTPAGSLPVGLRRPIDEGLTGHVIANGRPLLVADARNDETRRPWTDEPDFRSMLIMPVMVAGVCAATLEVGDERPNIFGDGDLVLMATAAEQVSAALLRIGLSHQSAQRAGRLALVADLARAISRVGMVEEALDVAAHTIFDQAGYTATLSALALPESDEHLIVSDYNESDKSLAGLRRPLGIGLIGHVFTTGEPLMLGRALDDPRYTWPGKAIAQSLLLVPVIEDGRTRAVLGVYDLEPDRLDSADLNLMTAVAGQVGASLRGVDLRNESEARAQRLAVTLEAARAVAAADSPEDVLETFVRTVFDGVGYAAVEASMPLDDQHQVIVASLDRDGSDHRGVIRPTSQGTTGAAFTEGRQVTLNDVPDAELMPGLIPGPSWRSRLATPVTINGEVVAVLNVGESQPNGFDAADRLFMQTVAEQVAAALRGARLRDQSQRRAERLAMALEVAETASASETVESALRSAALVIKRLVQCDAVAGFIALRDSGEQLGVVDSDVGGDSVEGMRRPIGAGYTGRAFAGGEQVMIGRHAQHHDESPWHPSVWQKYESMLLTPIASEGTIDALIVLYDSRPDRFDEDDAVMMRTVAEQLAAALRGARLRDESDRRAVRLAITLDVARAVAEADSVDDALRAAARAVFRATRYAAVTAILIDGDSNEELVLADELRTGDSILGMRRPLAARGTGMAALTGEAALFEQAGSDPDYAAWGDNGFESALAVPVMLEGVCVATLAVYGQLPRAFDEQDLVLMRTVAEQVAAALRGLRLRDQSEARAQRLEQLELRHRALLERLVRAQEQERSRVAADLHDDTVQVLSACVIALDRVRRSIEAGETERAAATLSEVSQLIAEAVDRTRRMTFELRPAVLWHHGLEAALKQLVGTVESEAGIAARLDVDASAVRLDATLETIAFRSIAELVANVRSHSGAKNLTVTVTSDPDQLCALVEDDGRGFDVELALARARATNHLGLEALIERVDAAGGDVEVDSTIGAGTRVTMRLPIRPAAT